MPGCNCCAHAAGSGSSTRVTWGCQPATGSGEREGGQGPPRPRRWAVAWRTATTGRWRARP
ncbi:hypothetical protein STAFG_2136 [Streptomyces afghaniensis 772]|uniref:Uncharacterized protein n=1 Tax=Streptomyces afghaniensis 772 TaxID=1283301 RepID=S4MVC7_9ACTN|nr:hypothetical protein STAFG_2136 [Streptomyces afghaniensis 772]